MNALAQVWIRVGRRLRNVGSVAYTCSYTGAARNKGSSSLLRREVPVPNVYAWRTILSTLARAVPACKHTSKVDDASNGTEPSALRTAANIIDHRRKGGRAK